jgi:hypothetical protein
MTKSDRASEILHSNEWCDPPQGSTARTPTARGPAVAVFRGG